MINSYKISNAIGGKKTLKINHIIVLVSYPFPQHPKFVNNSKKIIIKNKISLLQQPDELLLQHDLSSLELAKTLFILSVGICNPPFVFILFFIFLFGYTFLCLFFFYSICCIFCKYYSHPYPCNNYIYI